MGVFYYIGQVLLVKSWQIDSEAQLGMSNWLKSAKTQKDFTLFSSAAPDGAVRACDAVHVDPLTGLIQPSSNAHMLLASGHSMPVPPDFFLHPQTGKLLPVAGNVGFDPASSTLVLTGDACLGESLNVLVSI